MRLSIALVSWNTTALLGDCLDSIGQYRPRCEYEVIVVDNASQDMDEQEFRARFPEVNLIANPDNAGYAKGNNQAFEIAVGDYVLLLNPDTRVTEGALDALVDFMDRHPDASAAGAKLVKPDGTAERSVRGFPYPVDIASEFLGLSRIFRNCPRLGKYRMSAFSYTEEAEVDQPMGSCLIMRRKAIQDVGLFDESFPVYFNEVDWLYRAKKKGWKVYFTPSAVVVHHGAASTKQLGRKGMIRESHDSLIRFYHKHFRTTIPASVYYMTIACIHMGRFLRR